MLCFGIPVFGYCSVLGAGVVSFLGVRSYEKITVVVPS